MRSAYRLLLVPLVLLLATLLATWYAVRHARASIEEQFGSRIIAIAKTITGPPTFRLTPAVLEQMKSLTGADFMVTGPNEPMRTKDYLSTFYRNGPEQPITQSRRLVIETEVYLGYQIQLQHPHPNAEGTLYVYFPESILDTEVNNAIRPVLWLGLGGGMVATLLSGYISWRYAQAERKRLLSQVSDGLAHQLRNAATGAKLALQVAVTGDDVDRESLDVAARQLERVELILKQFLNQHQALELNLESVDVRTVIDAVVKLETPRALHAGTQLAWRRPDGEIRQAIDVAQWTHLVSNLLGNAIDAAGAGGTVALALTPEQFSVTDSGPGPSPEIAAKLFEPFVTGKPGGIGLGLMVAQQVADAHGHRLAWQRENDSTVFSVTFKRS